MVFRLVVEVLWLFLPAILANIAPVLAAYGNYLPSLNRPLDFGLFLSGRRLLGDHKTWRGLLLGVLTGAATGYLQYVSLKIGLVKSILIFPSPAATAFIYGACLGLGALLGDAVKSFFKRRLNIASGSAWLPWDQIDLVCGALAAAVWFVRLSLAQVAASFFLIGAGSYIMSRIGVALGIKKSL